jgi:hypothetical protein
MMKLSGLLRINTPDRRTNTNPTIIVSGPARSGTSHVAAALHAAGLWMGDSINQTVFEDMEMAGVIEARRLFLGRPAVLWAGGFHRLAFRGVDVPLLRRLIAGRNARFSTWGFKRPNITQILKSDGLHLFREPRLIMMIRDPLAVAERASIAEGHEMGRALDDARRATASNLKIVGKLGVPTLLISYERLKDNQQHVLEEVYRFAGLAVRSEDFTRIGEFVRQSGKEYKRLASAPSKGYISTYGDGVLRGWCRLPGEDKPVCVDIYVDDVKVAYVRADRYWPGLKRAGFGSGHHGFEVHLDPVLVTGASRIRAVISGSDIELENSGCS